MKVYHGSWMEIAEPDLKHSRTDVDFGKGFYTTPLREQAVKWCGKFKRRGKQGIVTTYAKKIKTMPGHPTGKFGIRCKSLKKWMEEAFGKHQKGKQNGEKSGF